MYFMGNVAKKFVDRAPRYILRASDNKTLRFSLEDQVDGPIFSTTFVNVSLTGLAFIVHQENSPRIGDVIKVEFPVPGSGQVAWWGVVVRTERYRPRRGWHLKEKFDINEEVYVAVKFESLPDGHRNAILGGLRQKAHEIALQRRAKLRVDLMTFVKEHFWRLVVFAICSILTFTILFLLSQPSKNYDAKKGSPWGHRFNF